MKYEFSKPKTTLPRSGEMTENRDMKNREDYEPSPVINLRAKQPGVTAPDGDALTGICRSLLEELGEDTEREGLVRTPARMAESFRYLTSGNGQDLREVLNEAVFDAEDYSEPVLVRNVEFYSLCEHHLLPFFGHMSVAYIPSRKVIGLSKIPRLIDVYARRLQLQERLTNQVAGAIQELLDPKGVAVWATAFHLCMSMRGVSKQESVTGTMSFLGDYRRDAGLRREFLSLVQRDNPLPDPESA
jgi:GTP cyclohydrolase IA